MTDRATVNGGAPGANDAPSSELAPSATTETRPHVGVVSGLVTLALTVPALLWILSTGFRIDLGLLFAMYGLIALGFYLPFVLGGSLSLAYNAYFGIGAYAVAIWVNFTDLSVWWSIPLGMIIAGVVAALLAFVTRGLSGFYLAIVTLLFGVAFERWLSDSRAVTGGGAGIGGIPQPELFGLTLTRPWVVALGVLIFWAAMFGLARVRSSLFGITLQARREIKTAVDAVGVNTTKLDMLTLGIGAAIASIGGVLTALTNRFVIADSFSIHIIFMVLFIPLLGGRARPWGVAIGSAIVVTLTMALGFFADTTMGSLAFGLGVLLVLLFLPSGIYGFVKSAGSRAWELLRTERSS